MSWFEQVTNWLDMFFNKPLPIVGVSLAVILIFVWKLFIKSSYGKKKYNEIKNGLMEARNEFSQAVSNFNDLVSNVKSSCDKKVEAIEEYYECKLAQKQAKEDELEALLLSIGDNIHNEKIQGLIKAYKEKNENVQTIMTDRINMAKAEYDERLKAIEDNLGIGKEKVEEVLDNVQEKLNSAEEESL